MRQYPTMTTSTSTQTACDMSPARSLLTDPEIAHIVNHLNEEHVDELCGFLTAFSPLTLDNSDDIDIKIREVYPEGVVIEAKPLIAEDATARANTPVLRDTEAQTAC